jgi:hypothetical protein
MSQKTVAPINLEQLAGPEPNFSELEPDQRNLLRDAFSTAVGFTDASWNPTEPAEVDATDAPMHLAKSASVAKTECS